MRIGVDLGGTKIEAVALADHGAAVARRRVATPRDDYDATLEAISRLVQGVEREAGERGTVGVGPRVARPALLLRQDRLHRDLPLGTGTGSRFPRGHGQ